MQPKVLLLGAGGQLGLALKEAAPANVELAAFARQALDITNRPVVREVIQTMRPQCIINAAAYTKVDKAEAETELACAVNAEAPAFIAETAPPETRLIHISTDFVFNGESQRPYKPSDAPAPVNAYGRSKLHGERAFLTTRGGNAVVIRVSWLYSAGPDNFVGLMLSAMRRKDEIKVVSDQWGSPTAAHTLAEVIWKMAFLEQAEGVFHWSDRGVISRHEFACAIQEEALKLALLDREVKIFPISMENYKTAAARPRYAVLDSSETEALVGMKTKPWREQLAKVLLAIRAS